MNQVKEFLFSGVTYGVAGTGFFVNFFNPATFKSDILFVGGAFLLMLQIIHQLLKFFEKKEP
jgi:hypothetical protein